MPWNVGAAGRERPAYPEFVERFGEDPARWLFTRDPAGIGPDRAGDTPELATAVSIIRGIEDPERLAAWQHVETDLSIGPRRPVIRAINRKRAELRGDTDAADLSLPAIFDPEDLTACRDDRPAADGGASTLPPGHPEVCDACGTELAYQGQGVDARGRHADELACPNPECDAEPVYQNPWGDPR